MLDFGTLSDDENLLIRRVLDKAKTTNTQNYLTNTCFLNEREQIIAKSQLQREKFSNYIFYGGYSESVRKIIVFLPDYITQDDLILPENNPICVVRAAFYREYSLSHRDFLGALTGAGISREFIGDILVDDEEKCAFIIVQKSVLCYLLNDFVSVGRAKIECREIDFSQLKTKDQKYKTITDTVASLRLDCVVATAFNLSREKASNLIEGGTLELNYFPCQKPDKLTKEGDKFSLRGYGKAQLFKVGSLSKKGRIFIEVLRFL